MSPDATTELRDLALARGAQIEEVDASQLAIEPWQGSVKLNHHLVWDVCNPDIEPTSDRRIAVDDNKIPLWVNDPERTLELAQFWNTEELTRRLADEPTAMAAFLVELCYPGLKLLEKLDDVETTDDEQAETVKKLADDFHAPKLGSQDPPVLSFWTHSHRNGDVEQWQVTLGKGLIEIEREVKAEGIGIFLRLL